MPIALVLGLVVTAALLLPIIKSPVALMTVGLESVRPSLITSKFPVPLDVIRNTSIAPPDLISNLLTGAVLPIPMLPEK